MANLIDLEFALAYADVNGLMNKPFTEVWEQTEFIKDQFCEDTNEPAEFFIENYLGVYNTVKENHLEDEVFSLVRSGEYNFFAAANEWDCF